MKKLVLIVAVFVVIVLGIVYLTTWATSGLLESHKDASALCVGSARRYVVTIQNDTVTPARTQASRCDKLMIVNRDSKTREIAFGVHDRHVAYGGVFERVLRKGESFTFELKQTGEYLFHDHFQDEVAGTFIVR